MTPEPLTVANRYRLLERLGKGGMGEVWKAQDLTFENLCVAIKLLNEDDTRSRDADSRRRLERDLRKERSSDRLSVDTIVRLMRAAFGTSRGTDKIRARVVAHAPDGILSAEGALALFDECAEDPDCSDSAKQRSDLHMRFKREANTLASLTHPNIVRVSNFNDGTNGIVPFLVMDYIEGETLADVIQREDPLPLDRKLELMEGLCAGLTYAHRKDVVHRDIKPLNLIIEDSTGTLKIVDFGVVRRLDQKTETSLGVVVGTFRYMSPEQISGEAALDGRSDIFSAGLVLYELVTGEAAFPPRENESLHEVVTRIREEMPRPIREVRPNLPADLEPILAKALAKDPASRYQDSDLMRQDLSLVRAALSRVQVEKTVVLDHGPRIQLLVEAARRARSERRLTDAIAALTEACGLEPSRGDLAAELAAVRQEAAQAATVRSILTEVDTRVSGGDLDSAIGILERAPVHHPDLDARKVDLERERRMRALVTEARAARQQGRFADAIARYEEAVRVGPGQAEVARELNATVAEEREASARQAALEVAHAVRTLLADATAADGAHRYAEAIEKLEEACRLAPDRPELVQQLTVSRQRLKAWSDRAAADRQADAAIAHADALARKGRKGRDQAIRWLESQGSTHPRVMARLSALNEERTRDLERGPSPPARAWWKTRTTMIAAAVVILAGIGALVVRGGRQGPGASTGVTTGGASQAGNAGPAAATNAKPKDGEQTKSDPSANGGGGLDRNTPGTGPATGTQGSSEGRDTSQTVKGTAPGDAGHGKGNGGGVESHAGRGSSATPGNSSATSTAAVTVSRPSSGPSPSDAILLQARQYVDANDDEAAVKYLMDTGKPSLGEAGFAPLIRGLVARARESAQGAQDTVKAAGIASETYATATARFGAASTDATSNDPVTRLGAVAEFRDAAKAFDAAARVDATYRRLRAQADTSDVTGYLSELIKAEAANPQEARFSQLVDALAARVQRSTTAARDGIAEAYRTLPDYRQGEDLLARTKGEPAPQAIADLGSAAGLFGRVSAVAGGDQTAIRGLLGDNVPGCYDARDWSCMTKLFVNEKSAPKNPFGGIRSIHVSSTTCGEASIPNVASATISCDLSMTQVDDRGGNQTFSETLVFQMAKVDGKWLIGRMDFKNKRD